MTTACIIQARIGSTRLPGKVLLPLGDGTVLSSVINRCAAIRGVNIVSVCIPDTEENNVLMAVAKTHGHRSCIRGPEYDVLERYRIAADTLGATTIMRITSDCPLIDPSVAELVLKRFKEEKAQFASNDHKLTCGWPYGLGVEVFSIEALWMAALHATEEHEREHVSPWISKVLGKDGPTVSCPIHLSKRLWAVDTREDYERVRAIHTRLPRGRLGWSWIQTMRTEDSIPQEL